MALAADAAEQGGGSQLNVGLGPLCRGERPGKTSRGFWEVLPVGSGILGSSLLCHWTVLR